MAYKHWSGITTGKGDALITTFSVSEEVAIGLDR